MKGKGQNKERQEVEGGEITRWDKEGIETRTKQGETTGGRRGYEEEVGERGAEYIYIYIETRQAKGDKEAKKRKREI